MKIEDMNPVLSHRVLYNSNRNNSLSNTCDIIKVCRHKKTGFVAPICFEKQFVPSLDVELKY